MFCYQCEQTAKGTGCTIRGVCSKDETTATLQDLLLHAAKGIAQYAHRAHELGMSDREVDIFTVEALFATITNVDFDPERLQALLTRAAAVKEKAGKLYEDAARAAGKEPDSLGGPAAWKPAPDLPGLLEQGREASIPKRHEKFGDDRAALMDLILFGLKGVAAYTDHAHVLGQDDDNHSAEFHRLLALLTEEDPAQDALLKAALDVGKLNLRAMELLDAGNTGNYGHPVPTPVRVIPVKGKAILVSGHDIKDLEMLLEQTEGKGVNVYTHGEMLPAHGYPELKKHRHLAGNYGSAWQNQHKEFSAFPGSILLTTNCLMMPQKAYVDRLFTTGLVAWPDVAHIPAAPDGSKDFTRVIEAALAAAGFAEDEEGKSITVGFGRNAVMAVADKVIAAVMAGRIKHFFLIGGCDGAKPGRNYYTELAEKVPQDSVILTLACGKYRFNKLDFGAIDGIPRLLDVGQCNDAYSAIQIALALSKATGLAVNDLPLSIILSWYEQKAVAVLLTLLHLGIRNIRIGPSLPAFVTPNVLQVLVDSFGLKPISTPDEDLRAILGSQ